MNTFKERILFGLLVATGVLLAVSASALPLPTQMLGENGGANDHPHNLSSLSTGTIHASAAENEQRICVFCHTPHGASAKGALWNRQDPVGPNGDGSFPLYGNLAALSIDEIGAAKYTNTDPTVEYPNGASRLCLSCHDGVSAVGEVINGGPLASLAMSTQATIDLSTSHPISFVYDGTVLAALTSVAGKGNYLLPPATYLDAQQRMQCTACHDPHVDTRVAGAGGYSLPMWAHYTGDETADYDNTCNSCHGAGFATSFPGGANPGHDNF